MYLAIVLTAGKYLFLVLIYLFAFMVFRGMLQELTRPEAGGQAGRPATRSPRQVPDPRTLRAASVSEGRAGAPSRPPARAPSPKPTHRPAQVPVAPPRPRLVIIKPGEGTEDLPREMELSAAVTIGRAQDNSITLPDRYVSAHHAQIYLRQGVRYLLDRGSTNGTLLNGRPVEGEVVLKDRDQISIGTTIFEYRAS